MADFKNLTYFKENYFYLYIFFFALVIRTATVVLFPLQTAEYEVIATNILKGAGFVYPHFGGAVYRSYCEPLYPFICVIVYFLSHHSFFMLAFIQAIFSSAIAVVIYFCAKNLFGQKIALLAMILVAIHPGLIILTTKLHPFTLDALCISLVLLTTIKLFNNLSSRNITIVGLISGLCILARPTILVFLPLALVFIFRMKKTKVTKSIIYSAMFLVVTSAIFLPWTLRNYFVQKQFMLTRSNVPYVFWLGNNPNFSGSATDKTGRSLWELAPNDFREKIESLDEVGQNKEFFKRALIYIKKYPLGFIKRTIKKFYYFWWFTPNAGILYPKEWLLIYKLFYLFVLINGMIGIFFTYREGMFRNKAGTLLVVFILFSISLVQSLFYIDTRHRWGVEPIFLIFTAKGIHSVFQKLRYIILKTSRQILCIL